MERARFKDCLLLIAFAALLLLVVVHFNGAVGLLGNLMGVLHPVILAAIIAFVLNVPMNAIGNRLEKLFAGKSKRPSQDVIGAVSLLLTLLALVLVIVLVTTTAVPGLVQSVRSIYDLIQQKLPLVLAYLESLQLDTDLLESFFSQLNVEGLLQSITSNAGSVLSAVVGTASSTIGALTSFAIALVIALYIMLGKRTLGHQARALAYANLKRERADRLCYIARLIGTTYSKFLSGQCIEAVILGMMLFVSLGLAKVPYAGVLATLTAVMSFTASSSTDFSPAAFAAFFRSTSASPGTTHTKWPAAFDAAELRPGYSPFSTRVLKTHFISSPNCSATCVAARLFSSTS